MIHHLQHIVDLVEICRLKGIRDVVVSPGSRNAPLIRLFTSNKYFTCHSIVDERSAGFYGLGISLATQKPVILICTSGTAVLNYAPALAEAFYQHVPLIAITADRPAHLIDQQDNQTIHQQDVYRNYIKGSINLEWPVHSEEELKNQHTGIDEILNFAVSGLKGPVHINVPISEPLYEALPQPSPLLSLVKNEISCPPEIERDFIETWNQSSRRIILCGQNTPNKVLQQNIFQLTNDGMALVLAEPISNIKGVSIISAIDRVMMVVEQSELEPFQPDLLVSLGGPVVSKRLKQWLQKQPDLVHWRIANDDDNIDTYQNRKALLKGKPVDIMKKISETGTTSDPHFLNKWQCANIESFKNDDQFFETSDFSDSSVFHFILNHLPEKVTLHLGNSSPVRYAQIYNCFNVRAVYSNRGVSGIDGCLSTASGIASVSEGLHLVLLGDLSFVYDSNALWNRNLPKNLRIVVINNGGGGIFRLLPGPSEQECFEPFMEAHHPVDLEKLTTAFGLNYDCALNQKELEHKFIQLIQYYDSSLLEVRTVNTINPVQFNAHIKSIKSQGNFNK